MFWPANLEKLMCLRFSERLCWRWKVVEKLWSSCEYMRMYAHKCTYVHAWEYAHTSKQKCKQKLKRKQEPLGKYNQLPYPRTDDCLTQWFSNSLMLQSFIRVPHVVVNSNHNYFCCYFISVILLLLQIIISVFSHGIRWHPMKESFNTQSGSNSQVKNY